jgi:hypothetical protein
MIGSDDEGDLGADGEGAFLIELAVLIVATAVEDAQEGNARAHHVHGGRVLRKACDEPDHFFREVAVRTQLAGQLSEFGPVGKPAAVEQVDDFLEGAVGHEVIDGVPEIAEFAIGSIHVTETRFVGDDSFKTFGDQ